MKKFLLAITMVFALVWSVSAQIIITGVLKNPEGDDYVGGKGYEFVQFMATENITNATNYSVILGRNSDNSQTGWVNTSNVNSYKINIANLSVSKGQYFYLVGMDAKFSGPSSAAFPSTTVKIQFDQSSGGANGQGNAVTSSTGFFPSSHPAGIAVFNTQSVTSTTRPIDAIFFGEASVQSPAAGAYKLNTASPVSPSGYTVPTYANGADPLYFDATTTTSPGTNSFYLVAANGTGRFYKFSGDYDTSLKKWTTTRVIDSYNIPVDATAETILANLEVGTILPIALSSFTAKGSNQGVQLNWSTSSELNNAYFQVLRKSATENEFAAVGGKIKGAGTTNNPQQYQFTDTKPQSGANYYKLAQVDFDGKAMQSNVVFAYGNLAKNTTTVTYANGSLAIKFDAAKASLANIIVVDVNGKTVHKVLVNAVFGVNSIVNKLNFVAGVYVVKLSVGSDVSATKFVVK